MGPGINGASVTESPRITLPHVRAEAAPSECLFGPDGQVLAAFYPSSPSDPRSRIKVFRAGAGYGTSWGESSAETIPVSYGSRFSDLDRGTMERITGAVGVSQPEQAVEGHQGEVAPTEAATLRRASYNPTTPSTTGSTTTLRVTSRTYDALNRLASETVQLEGGGTATVLYTYWPGGLRKSVTDASGRVTFYEYNSLDLLSSVTTNQGLPNQQVTSYEYWGDGLLKTVKKPDNTVTSYVYSPAGRLTNILVRKGGVALLSYAYAYDRNGNRTSQVEVNGGTAETTTYTYDDLNRLETATYPNGHSVAYGYDGSGNRVRETERDAAGVAISDKTAVFDGANRLSTVTDAVNAANNATFTYDRNGNLTGKTTPAGVSTYVYDLRGQLAETRQGEQVTARFAHDAFGRRYLKIGDEGIRQYLYDQTSLLQEFNEINVEVAKYEWGGDRLVSLFRANEPQRYFHFDALGSVAALTEASGDVAARYHYDAWGRHRDATELAASANRFGFTGHYFDTETKLYYATARFYDPEYGRFLTADTYFGDIENPPSLHLYAYGWNRPTFFVDPSGHAVIESEELYNNELLQRTQEYDPSSGSVRHETICGGDRTCITAQSPDIRLRAVLAQAGGDKERAYQILLGMQAAGQRSAAGIQIEESDFTTAGQLDTAGLFRQFIGRVGTHAGSISGLREEFYAAVEGAQVGEVRDISYLYNVGYGYSTAVANRLAQSYAEETTGPDFIQRSAHLAGQWGAAPPDVSGWAAVSLAGDTLAAVSAGLGVYRLGAGLASAEAGTGFGEHGVNLLDPKQLQPRLASVRFGPARGGGGSAADQAYAYRVTGGAEKATYVNGTEFEGVRGGVLIDAKRSSGSGSFYDISGADSFTQNVRIPKILDQAQRQLRAAQGQGFRGIRWEVSDANVAQQLQTLFSQRGVRIQVIYTGN